MFRRLPVWAGVTILVALGALGGCQGPQTAGTTSGGLDGQADPTMTARRDEGGLLLRTGAIQLGPGVGRNRWGWQGDGLGGF
jgi:hypothetical protein